FEDVVADLRRRSRPCRESGLGGGNRGLRLRARAAHRFADDTLGVGWIDVRRASAIGQPFAIDQTIEHQHGCTPCFYYRPLALRHTAKSFSVCSSVAG